ncbi:putative proline iminopeptidase [Azospirillaceae bacterium]
MLTYAYRPHSRNSLARADFYPPIDPLRFGFLNVDSLHTLYWEESGNPEGVPIVFLHGGPGAGAAPIHRRFFDPQHYRIIVFDQRGSGRSKPLGEIRNNDTDLLVQDMEALREMLGISRWHLFGGSWGSTLALVYAQTHPEKCLSLTLRGIFLLRPSEILWFLYGMRTVFPEAWRTFSNYIPQPERRDLLEAYWNRLNAQSSEVRITAARTWSLYEGACSTLLPISELISSSIDDNHALSVARIEAHYFRNNLFKPENRLLENIHRIRHIPGVIIQGRYDIVCPIVTADELHREWPEADYYVIPDAGHTAMEPGVRGALVAATERFKAISV